MTFDTKRGQFVALRNIDLAVRKGEFVTLIGHSGCGKSTLLNLVAGLLKPTTGVLLCAGREIAGPGPDRGVVFQNHSLLPWLTCFDNVYLAVERVFGASEKKAELKRRTHEALALVGLTHAEHKMPHEISGGMKQRVGIARALAMEPKVLLLDEPFGALDALTRAHLQDELMKIVAATGSTVLMVTHDVDEAVLLSDRIVMMTNGPAATIGEILSRSTCRGRAIASSSPRTPTTTIAGRRCSSSCIAGRCVRPRNHAKDEARHGRQRHGRRAHARGAAEDRARPLRHHGVRRRAAPELQPHPALAGAGRRADDRRDHAEPVDWYAEHGITLHLGQDGRRRSTASGASSSRPTAPRRPYDRLLLATGSNPFILPVPGKDLEGVITYRDIADTQRHDRRRDAQARGGDRRRPARARGGQRPEAARHER